MTLKNYLLLLLLSMGQISSTEAQTVGVGYYAIQNKTFPCEAALKVYDGIKKPALMFLWSTFGTNTSCIEKFAKMNNRKKEIYIHFSNECCRRNKTCKSGELLKNLSVNDLNKKLEAKDKKTLKSYENRMQDIILFIDKISEVSPNISWFISTGLEDNYSTAAAKIVLKNLKNFKKKSKFSNQITIYVNPLNSKCIINKCEIHRKDLGYNNHWIFLPDGYCVKPFDACNYNIFTEKEQENRLNSQVKNKNKYMVWWQGQQGRYGETPTKATNPRQRVIKISAQQVKQARKLLKKGN